MPFATAGDVSVTKKLVTYAPTPLLLRIVPFCGVCVLGTVSFSQDRWQKQEKIRVYFCRFVNLPSNELIILFARKAVNYSISYPIKRLRKVCHCFSRAQFVSCLIYNSNVRFVSIQISLYSEFLQNQYL